MVVFRVLATRGTGKLKLISKEINFVGIACNVKNKFIVFFSFITNLIAIIRGLTFNLLIRIIKNIDNLLTISRSTIEMRILI